MEERMGREDRNEVITPKGDLLTYIKKGVLWIQKKPHYIVELVREPDLSYVMVYQVHPGTDNNPKKLAVEMTHKQNSFSQKTLLGRLASSILPNKVTKKWVPKEPLFVAPIIQNQVSTFTGVREAGFFEREEDRVVSQGGEKKWIRGQNTGVFIGLSSIDWEEGYSIPTKSILETLTRYKEDRFFDLTGNNSDPNNPLATFYRKD